MTTTAAPKVAPTHQVVNAYETLYQLTIEDMRSQPPAAPHPPAAAVVLQTALRRSYRRTVAPLSA